MTMMQAKREKMREKMRLWRAANREKCREYQRRYQAKYPEKRRNKLRAWRARNKLAKDKDALFERTKQYNKMYAAENREKMLARYRKYRREHRRERRDYGAYYYAKMVLENPERCRRISIKKEHYRRKQRIAQAGRQPSDCCEICSAPVKTVFDHCHRTGVFRGWICASCNTALGSAKDDPKRLENMIAYLHKHSHGSIIKLDWENGGGPPGSSWKVTSRPWRAAG